MSSLVLESGDNAGVDYWWNDYGLGGPDVGKDGVACSSINPSPNPNLTSIRWTGGNVQSCSPQRNPKGAFQVACSPNDSSTPTQPEGPPSFPHCSRCYDDDAGAKPQLWNSYVRVSRPEVTLTQILTLFLTLALNPMLTLTLAVTPSFQIVV